MIWIRIWIEITVLEIDLSGNTSQCMEGRLAPAASLPCSCDVLPERSIMVRFGLRL